MITAISLVISSWWRILHLRRSSCDSAVRRRREQQRVVEIPADIYPDDVLSFAGQVIRLLSI
ncbi:MAG: hypothetical protein ACOYXU_06860 [Nitrospirota bacterium]